MKRLTYIALLLITINCGREIYKCEDDGFKDEQCMKREVLGKNTFYWLKKCKGAQVCVQLPYYGKMIGACSIKVRSHYDGESCANDNKCTSGVCGGTKCKGKTEGENCEIGLGQCKKGLLCRYELGSNGLPVANSKSLCGKPLNKGDTCLDIGSTGVDEDLNTIHSYYMNPANNFCKLGFVCSNTICVEIGSISNGQQSTNPLACSSGLMEGGNCVASLTDKRTTSLGAECEIGSNTTTAFNEWKTEVRKDEKDEDAIYEAYRYTRNKKKTNKAWFIYTHNAFVRDSDECAFDYLWKQSSSNYIQFSLIILIFTLLF